MPKKKNQIRKQIVGDKVIDKLPETEDAKRRRRKTTAIITASAILAFIIAVSFAGWYLAYKAPLEATIIKVNDESVSVGYLLNRCLLNSSDTNDTMGTIQSIIQERVIEQVASQPPYNITVSEADIDKELRNEANSSLSTSSASTSTSTSTTTTTPTMSDAEFNVWYRQTLDQSKLSVSQFRDIVRVGIMASRLNTYLVNRMSTTAPQVHLYDILLPDSTTATDVMNRINNGEDFMTIAKELSTDSNTASNGGDMGWVPLKVLDSNLENVATSLDIGKVSYPVQLSTAQQSDQSSSSSSDQDDQPYYLLMITGKADSREIDPQYINTLQSRLLQDWLNAEMTSPTIKITLHGKGVSGGYDSQTDAWVQYEIEKLKASRGITETTSSTTTNPATGQ